MLNLNNKVVLITGGTGSFGKKFVEVILRDYPNVKKVIVYSRDEQRQLDMQQQFSEEKYPMMRYFIGDVRDLDRLKRACEGVDIFIHAAAIRNVNTAEYNPDECIKTNILGAQNVIDAALACGVKDVIALSSAAACAPTNLYGATKLTSDKLFCAANNIAGNKGVRFSVVRFSNVLGDRGTAYPIFEQAIKNKAKALPIVDQRMTRFNISIMEGISSVLFALEHHLGGEIFVPKCMSYKVIDLARAMAPKMPVVELGLRPNEKLHEELIASSDAQDTIDLGNCYAILPAVAFIYTRQQLIEHYQAPFVSEAFCYCSNNNKDWDTVESLRSKIKRYIDSNFEVK
ncbi:MAG: UDP-N-acetylglucosamine 4,6-dehydratase (inverting) [Paludibacteraceae bacterium]|nr:UDP-N-acetylglucosamine 4,6-dehydratase (inverting) [Paludibacteraceae bacterium]